MIFENKKQFDEFIKLIKINNNDLVEIKVPRSKEGALIASEIQERLCGMGNFVIGFKDE